MVRYLAGTILLLALVAAVAIWLVDREDFPMIGDGLWWAIVTLSTVGYGDLVPHSSGGRVIGGLVILVGVTFIAMLTSTVTSYFVSTKQEARATDLADQRDDDDDSRAALQAILERLDSIEATLESLRGDDQRQ